MLLACDSISLFLQGDQEREIVLQMSTVLVTNIRQLSAVNCLQMSLILRQ